MIELSRNLKQYRDVENFEDFELTNCIAYEFAIRVDEVIESIKNNFNEDNDYIFRTYGIGGEYWINYHFFTDVFEYILEDDETIYTESFGTVFQPGKYKIQKQDRNEDGDLEQTIRTDGMHIHTLIYDGSSFADKQSISPIYKRPHMYPVLIDRNIDFNINMNLPLEEIQAFIAHVYNYQKKNRNILASPFELLGGKISEADDIVKNTKQGDPTHNARLILKTQHKIANTLFIYDAYKLGWTKKKIENELNHYYYDKKDSQFDGKTINKYLDIAKEYIENLKYKELIEGVKTHKHNNL